MPLRQSKLFFTPRELAKILQLNVMTIYGYVRAGKLTAVKFGRALRIDKKDLDQFIKENKTNHD